MSNFVIIAINGICVISFLKITDFNDDFSKKLKIRKYFPIKENSFILFFMNLMSTKNQQKSKFFLNTDITNNY